MFLIGYFVLFFFAGFAGFLRNVPEYITLSLFLMLALLVGGVYLFGWWAILVVFSGMFVGAVAYQKNRIK